MKILLILVVGIAIGYGYGFSDAKAHSDNVVVRILGRVGGSSRGSIGAGADVDERMRRAEH